MNNSLIVKISEGLGNQLFMYAHAYSLSRKLNKRLLIDNSSGYYKTKNSLRSHQKYMLDFFEIPDDYAPDNLRYDSFYRNIHKKLLLFFDKFNTKKSFLFETKKKINNNKVVLNYNLKNCNFNDTIYVDGNFENESYFSEYRNDLINILSPRKEFLVQSNEISSKLEETNSISIHIRTNRFSDQIGLDNTIINKSKSDNFTLDSITHINKSIKYISDKVHNPKYFIWSNNSKNLDFFLNKINLSNFELIQSQDTINDFNLFKYAKHFIVSPSSFHWWGAWLNENDNKICLRPSNINPSNNKYFWPKEWISI